jgi:hypothetical protein
VHGGGNSTQPHGGLGDRGPGSSRRAFRGAKKGSKKVVDISTLTSSFCLLGTMLFTREEVSG